MELKSIKNPCKKLKLDRVNIKELLTNIFKCFIAEFVVIIFIFILIVVNIIIMKGIDIDALNIIKNNIYQRIDLINLFLIVLGVNIVCSYLYSLITTHTYELGSYKKLIKNDYENILERYLLGNYKSIFINARYGMGKTTLLNNCFKRETLKNKKFIILEPYVDNNELDYIDYLFDVFIEKLKLGKIYYILYLSIVTSVAIITRYFSDNYTQKNLIVLIYAVFIYILIKNIKIKREIKKQFIIWNLNRYDYIIIDDIDRCFYDEQIGNQILKIIHFIYGSIINSHTKLIICGDYSNLCDDSGENMIEKYVDNKLDISTTKIANNMILKQLFEGRQEYISKMYDENDWYLINEILKGCSLRSLQKIIDDLNNIEPIYLLDNIFVLIIKYEQKINIHNFFEKIGNINNEMNKYYNKLGITNESKDNIKDKIHKLIIDYFEEELTKKQIDYLRESYIIKYKLDDYKRNDYIDKKIVKKVNDYETLEIIPSKNSVTELCNNWKEGFINNPNEYLQTENLKIIKINSTMEERLKIVEKMYKKNVPYIFGKNIVEVICELYLNSEEEFPIENLALDLKYNLLDGGNYLDKTKYRKLENLVRNNLNELSEINTLNFLIREGFIQTDFNNRVYYKMIFENIENYNIYLKLLLAVQREINFTGLFSDDNIINKPNKNVNQELINKNLYGELINLLSYPDSWEKGDWDKSTEKLKKILEKFYTNQIIIENKELIQNRINQEFISWNEKGNKDFFKNKFLETNGKYSERS